MEEPASSITIPQGKNCKPLVIKPWDEFNRQLDSLLERLVEEDTQDRVFKAYKILTIIEHSYEYYAKEEHNKEGERKRPSSDALDAANTKIQMHKATIAFVKKRNKELRLLLDDLTGEEGWTITRNDSGIKTYYRNEPLNPVHSIKMEGVIPSPPLNILSCVNEVDLYHNWIPLMKETKVVKQLSKYRKTTYIHCGDLIWPVANRDAYCYGYGADLMEENKMVVYVRSVREDDTYGDFIAGEQESPEFLARKLMEDAPEEGKAVRVDSKFAGMLLIPVDREHTYVSMMTNTDPKMKRLPYWMLNIVTKRLAHQMFAMLAYQSTKFEGSEYERRVKDNTEAYGELVERLERYYVSLDREESKQKAKKLTKAGDVVNMASVERVAQEDMTAIGHMKPAALHAEKTTTRENSKEEKGEEVEREDTSSCLLS